MRTSRFAGVIVAHEDAVVLVREFRDTWGGAFWNLPSGRVEAGETPEQGAARELAEETGLVVAPAALALVSTVTTTTAGGRSQAWNFAISLVDPAPIAVDDPDGSILDARWFPREEAIRELGALPYRPLREPALGHLTGQSAVGTHWEYDLG